MRKKKFRQNATFKNFKPRRRTEELKATVKEEVNDVNVTIEDSAEKSKLSTNILKEKEAEIEKERLRLIELNKSEEKAEVQDSIQEKEDKLRKLLLERRELKKQLLEELKDKEEKKSLKDIVKDKKEVTSTDIKTEEEPEFYEYVEEEKNLFKVFIDSVRYYVSKYIFRKNIERLEYVRTARHGQKFKILFSIIVTLLTIMALVFFMKVFATSKDTYGDYLPSNATTTTTQSTVASTQSNNNENNQNNNENNNNSNLAEVASKEEEAAKTSYNPGITMAVAKDVKILEKIPTYQASGWDNKVGEVEKDTQLKVNAVSFPGGYMMYRIAEGTSAGQYITANPKLVEVTTNNDSMNFDFIAYPLAVTATEDQDIFEDKELTKAKARTEKNKVYNVKGYGVANNRLVYHLEDGMYLPFAGNVVQTQRTA